MRSYLFNKIYNFLTLLCICAKTSGIYEWCCILCFVTGNISRKVVVIGEHGIHNYFKRHKHCLCLRTSRAVVNFPIAGNNLYGWCWQKPDKDINKCYNQLTPGPAGGFKFRLYTGTRLPHCRAFLFSLYPMDSWFQLLDYWRVKCKNEIWYRNT